MNRTLRRLGCAALAVAGLALGWNGAQAAGGGSLDPSFVLYEDWTSAPLMRPDRWLATDNGALDIRREVKGHALVMRSRRPGGTASDVGFAGARHRLVFSNPTAIDRIGVIVDVRTLELSACATNPNQPSLGYTAITLNRFNDGSGGPGNMTGDHLLSINGYRDTRSTDPDGVLRFRGVILRCIDAVCSNAISIPGGVVDLPTTAQVGTRFAMRVVWDSANNQIFIGAGDDPDVALPYPSQVNQKPAGVPFADIRTQLVAANCTSGATATETTLAVPNVYTNAAAIIP